MNAPLVPSRRTSELLWSITGTYNDVLAHQKFAVFALVSSLLVPKSAKEFRRALKHEGFRKRRAQEFPCLLRSNARFDFRLNKLTAALVKSLRPQRHDGGSVFPPPHWVGEQRPKGARSVRVQSVFPHAEYLRYLVSKQGYEGSAAIAALSRAHNPWVRVSDRHQRTCVDADAQNERQYYGAQNPGQNAFAPAHPYYPVAPSRRTKVGGGLTKEQVQRALANTRWDPQMKQAVFEIVYRRRSTLDVSNESGRPVEILYVYASRLRKNLRNEEKVA